MAVSRLGIPWLKVVRGGLMAGLAQTATVYVIAAVFGLSVADVSAFLGGVLVGSSSAAVGVGRWLFALMALVWAFVFRSVGPALPGSTWQRGVLYGALVWAVSTGLLLPLLSSLSVDGPRPGLFGLGFGGAAAAFTSLSAHLVYGAVLAATLRNDERQAMPDPGPA